MGWNLNDLTSSADATAAASSPTGFVFPARGTQHVFYRGTDNHVHELRWDRSGWRRSDLFATLTAPAAAGDPVAFAALRAGTQHVIYAGAEGHVHELRKASSGWLHADLSATSGATAKVRGNPAACVLEKQGSKHVFFADTEGKVHELSIEGHGWRHTDVTASASGAAPAAGNLAALAHETTGARFVVYRGKDGHIHELHAGARGWHAADLTAIATGAPAAVGDPCIYMFEGQGTRHIDYRSADGHIHELWCDDKGWHHEDLTAETRAPAATQDPVGYMFNLQGTQHVLFTGQDQLLHELWWDVNGWHHDVPGSLGPAMTGRPAGYSFEMQKTQHAVYRQPDGRVAELWWHPDGTGTGGTGKSTDGSTIAMKWDPVVFDGGVPVSGGASLSVHADGRWEFTGHFHGSGFSPHQVNILWAVRTSKGALFTFAAEGAVSGTLGTGSRDFHWNLSGTDTDIKSAWSDFHAASNWQAQAGTSLEWGGLWSDIKGAVGEIHAITTVVGPHFS